jgi:2-oxo-4-hydroxy-4-carboxy-5-ureidoimidazoline decarboxylase
MSADEDQAPGLRADGGPRPGRGEPVDWGPADPSPPDRSSAGIERLNGLSRADAEASLLAACSSPPWAALVADGRPYADLAALQDRAGQVWLALGPTAWHAALAGHPRIGEQGGAAAEQSRKEQAGMAAAPETVAAAIAAGNRAYEKRFGHIFLVRAAGRTPAEVLDNLRSRLENDPDTELAVAAEQHAEIMALRLTSLVEADSRR